MTTTTLAPTSGLTRFAPVLFAAALGLGLIFAAGFGNASALHDVAHDTRHAVAFPCH